MSYTIRSYPIKAYLIRRVKRILILLESVFLLKKKKLDVKTCVCPFILHFGGTKKYFVYSKMNLQSIHFIWLLILLVAKILLG